MYLSKDIINIIIKFNFAICEKCNTKKKCTELNKSNILLKKIVVNNFNVDYIYVKYKLICQNCISNYNHCEQCYEFVNNNNKVNSLHICNYCRLKCCYDCNENFDENNICNVCNLLIDDFQ